MNGAENLGLRVFTDIIWSKFNMLTSNITDLSWAFHITHLTTGLWTCFQENFCNELELCAKGKKGSEYVVKVHHLILASFCPSFKQVDIKKLHLTIDEEDLNAIVEFLYNGKMKLKNISPSNVFKAAQSLDFQVLEDLIGNHLKTLEALINNLEPTLEIEPSIDLSPRAVNAKSVQDYGIKDGHFSISKKDEMDSEARQNIEDTAAKNVVITASLRTPTVKRFKTSFKECKTCDCSTDEKSQNTRIKKLRVKDLDPNEELNFSRLCAILQTEKDAILFLQKKNLLHNPRKCAKGHDMRLNLKRESRWLCLNVSCRKQTTVRQNTFFQFSELSYRKTVLIIYCWSQQLTTVKFCERELDISPTNAVKWCNIMKAVCAHSLHRDPVKNDEGDEEKLVKNVKKLEKYHNLAGNGINQKQKDSNLCESLWRTKYKNCDMFEKILQDMAFYTPLKKS